METEEEQTNSKSKPKMGVEKSKDSCKRTYLKPIYYTSPTALRLCSIIWKAL